MSNHIANAGKMVGMIVSDWDVTPFSHTGQGFCADVQVDAPRHERISELLGPDGEPLRIGYSRPRLGFDLTPRGRK